MGRLRGLAHSALSSRTFPQISNKGRAARWSAFAALCSLLRRAGTGISPAVRAVCSARRTPPSTYTHGRGEPGSADTGHSVLQGRQLLRDEGEAGPRLLSFHCNCQFTAFFRNRRERRKWGGGWWLREGARKTQGRTHVKRRDSLSCPGQHCATQQRSCGYKQSRVVSLRRGDLFLLCSRCGPREPPGCNLDVGQH